MASIDIQIYFDGVGLENFKSEVATSMFCQIIFLTICGVIYPIEFFRNVFKQSFIHLKLIMHLLSAWDLTCGVKGAK